MAILEGLGALFGSGGVSGLGSIFGGSSGIGATPALGGSSLLGGNLMGPADLFNMGMSIYGAVNQDRLNKLAQWNMSNAALIRRNDLENAGLSPTLAAGSAASPASLTNPTPPQAKLEQTLNAMAILRGQADITQTNAQTNLTKANATKILYDTSKSLLDAEGQKIENLFKKQELNDYVKSGVNPRNGSSIGKQIDDAIKIFLKEGGSLDQLKDKIMKTKDSLFNSPWGPINKRSGASGEWDKPTGASGGW